MCPWEIAQLMGLDVACDDSSSGMRTKWDIVELKLRGMLREVFSSFGPSVGHWPRSSAYYAVDVILDEDEDDEGNGVGSDGTDEGIVIGKIPEPKLLEINFMGDWNGIEISLGSSCR